jgi:hypothetical protein
LNTRVGLFCSYKAGSTSCARRSLATADSVDLRNNQMLHNLASNERDTTSMISLLQARTVNIIVPACDQTGAIPSVPCLNQLSNILDSLSSVVIRFRVRGDVLLEDEVLWVIETVCWPCFGFDYILSAVQMSIREDVHTYLRVACSGRQS